MFSFCVDISERLDTLANDTNEEQVNPEDVSAIVQNLIAQQMQGQSGFDADVQEENTPVNDLGTISTTTKEQTGFDEDIQDENTPVNDLGTISTTLKPKANKVVSSSVNDLGALAASGTKRKLETEQEENEQRKKQKIE